MHHSAAADDEATRSALRFATNYVLAAVEPPSHAADEPLRHRDMVSGPPIGYLDAQVRARGAWARTLVGSHNPSRTEGHACARSPTASRAAA
ncbi:uncharacterized protein EHS24_003099 [Apiotrichum porosum]|uniref:Uncharacterized protein n=1 Tax=Apiotrichum porosum TaxID=105984 RepID=A0A427XFM1_9TREE|nr:uncharacterized protein EHS24_003099 [Apiotrichum porosum]RSH77543.1 hypothetical protein EHS24_003099 [Apiotrichum porosum]